MRPPPARGPRLRVSTWEMGATTARFSWGWVRPVAPTALVPRWVLGSSLLRSRAACWTCCLQSLAQGGVCRQARGSWGHPVASSSLLRPLKHQTPTEGQLGRCSDPKAPLLSRHTGRQGRGSAAGPWGQAPPAPVFISKFYSHTAAPTHSRVAWEDFLLVDFMACNVRHTHSLVLYGKCLPSPE